MGVGYIVTNRFATLSTSAFTWSTAYSNSTAEKASLIDGRLSSLCPSNAAASTSPIDLQIDMGSSVNLRGIAVLGHTLWSGAGWTAPQIVVQSADDSGFSVNLTTQKAATTVPQYTNRLLTRDTALQFPGNTAARYWRIRFQETSGTPSRLVSVAEVFGFGAEPTTLTRMPIYGEAEGRRYVTNEVELANGDVSRSYRGGPILTRRFTFADLDSSQRDELLTMHHATQGGVNNLLWLPTISSSGSAGSTASQECYLGRLQPTLGWVQGDYSVYDVDGFELVTRAREIGA